MQRRGYHYYFQNLPIRSLHDNKIWEYNKNTNRENKVAKTLENEDWSSEVIQSVPGNIIDNKSSAVNLGTR